MTAEKLIQLRESIINFATVIMFTRKRWRVLTKSRFLGMTYTNGTKETITVDVSFSSNGGTSVMLSVFIDDVAVKSFSVIKPHLVTISFEVAPGSSYSISYANKIYIDKWSEFRT